MNFFISFTYQFLFVVKMHRTRMTDLWLFGKHRFDCRREVELRIFMCGELENTNVIVGGCCRFRVEKNIVSLSARISISEIG